jgi:hypothetical protein
MRFVALTKNYMSTDSVSKAHLRYEVIESADKNEFEQEVNSRLKQGWILHGTTQYFPYAVNNDGSIQKVLYIQSLQK